MRQVLKLDLSLNLTNRITSNFACEYRPPNWRTSFWFYFYHSNWLVSRHLRPWVIFYKQIFVFCYSRHCTNVKLQYKIGPVCGNVLNQYQPENVSHATKKNTTRYCGDNKSWTMFCNFVACIYIQSFAWFCMLIVKICLTLRPAAMLLVCEDVITTLFAYYKKKRKKNKPGTKINIEKRFTPAFMIFNNLILTNLN